MKHVRALFNCSVCKNKYISQSKLDTHINKTHKKFIEQSKMKNNETKSNIFSDVKWKEVKETIWNLAIEEKQKLYSGDFIEGTSLPTVDNSKIGSMISTFYGDITMLEVDILVSSNEGGLDSDIERKAGPLHAVERANSSSNIFGGYNLPAKNVLNIEGPFGWTKLCVVMHLKKGTI